MGQRLFYSHATPEKLRAQLADVGLAVRAFDARAIGGETFLWVTAAKLEQPGGLGEAALPQIPR